MKIGILSFHRTVNDGSVLQNWCLQQVIRSLSPLAQPETIDLRDSGRERLEVRRMLSRKPPFVQVTAVRKMMGLRQFAGREIKLSPRLTTSSLAEAREFVAAQGYRAVFSGSDTVWQLARIGDTAPPHVYYQPGFGGFRKIAFAVSADPIADKSQLEDGSRRAALLEAVTDFDFIGIRDEPTRQMLLSIGVPAARIEFMPDPTFLVDFSHLVKASPRTSAQPVAGVALQSASLARTVSDMLQSQGWRVINHLGHAPPGAERISASETLGDRLGRFATQDLLVTDRFHSSIFTYKHGKGAVVFVESRKKWPEPFSKGRDLLERLGCGEFVWRPGDDPGKELLHYLDLAAEWRRDPPDTARRFATVRAGAEPALDKLAMLLQA